MKNKILMVSHSAKSTNIYRVFRSHTYMSGRISGYSIRRLRLLIATAANKNRLNITPYVYGCGWLAEEKKK
jgi:hypothetical protein